jgi:hypothetical protein
MRKLGGAGLRIKNFQFSKRAEAFAADADGVSISYIKVDIIRQGGGANTPSSPLQNQQPQKLCRLCDVERMVIPS